MAHLLAAGPTTGKAQGSLIEGALPRGLSLLPGIIQGTQVFSRGLDQVVPGRCWVGQSNDALAVVTRKACTLKHKVPAVIEIVQTLFILAGLTAVMELALFPALKFSPLTRC